MGDVLLGSDSRLDQDTVTTVPAEDSAFPASRLSDDREFTVFKPTSAATTVDIITDAGVGNTESVDYFMMLFHDLFDPALDGNGAVAFNFAHSADNIAYTTIFSGTATDNLILPKTFTQATNRYFRLRLTRGSSFIPSIGQLQWGIGVRFPFGVEVGFDPNIEQPRNRFNRGQTGNILGSLHNWTQRRVNLAMRLQTNAFVTGTSVGDFKEWWDNHGSIGEPFLVWWNADDTFRTDALFGVVDAQQGIRRPLRTPLATGWRDVDFSVVGRKEE